MFQTTWLSPAELNVFVRLEQRGPNDGHIMVVVGHIVKDLSLEIEALDENQDFEEVRNSERDRELSLSSMWILELRGCAQWVKKWQEGDPVWGHYSLVGLRKVRKDIWEVLVEDDEYWHPTILLRDTQILELDRLLGFALEFLNGPNCQSDSCSGTNYGWKLITELGDSVVEC